MFFVNLRMVRITYDDAIAVFKKEWHTLIELDTNMMMLYKAHKAFNRAKNDGRIISVVDQEEELRYEYALVHSSEISERAMSIFECDAWGVQFNPPLKKLKRDYIFVFTDHLPETIPHFQVYRELAAFHEAYELSLMNECFNPRNFFASLPHDRALKAQLRKARDHGDDFYNQYIDWHKTHRPDFCEQQKELETAERKAAAWAEKHLAELFAQS